jgi:hypothetical protein
VPPLFAEVEVTATAGQDSAFAHIAPIDLASIFTGYGPLPAVTEIQDQVEAWDAVASVTPEQTKIRWRYAFNSKSALAIPLL